jgi:hypothetical protein
MSSVQKVLEATKERQEAQKHLDTLLDSDINRKHGFMYRAVIRQQIVDARVATARRQVRALGDATCSSDCFLRKSNGASLHLESFKLAVHLLLQLVPPPRARAHTAVSSWSTAVNWSF